MSTTVDMSADPEIGVKLADTGESDEIKSHERLADATWAAQAVQNG